MSDLIARLDARYADDPNVYVSGCVKVYWETWNPYDLVVPDCFVAFGVPKRDRDKYLSWQEPALPSVVIEVFSTESAHHPPTLVGPYDKDLRVDELFLFDPFEHHRGPALKAYRRSGAGLAAVAVKNLAVTSSRLGVRLHVSGTELRLFDAETGAEVLTAPEREAASLRAELAELQARGPDR